MRGILFIAAFAPLIGGCAALGTSVGPSRQAVAKAPVDGTVPGLRVVDVTTAVRQGASVGPIGTTLAADDFAAVLGGASPIGTTVGVGDTIEVTIWEAAPAALFGAGGFNTRIGTPVSASEGQTLPGFQVGPSGTISVPFAGQVPAAGRTVRQIEQDIVRRLQGKAHQPQAVVRITRNVTETVSVLGDVKQPGQIALTPHGERILDVISQAGGSNQALDRMTVQITRDNIVRRVAARDLLSDTRNNVVLAGGDVVTVLYQPYSFTVLGAAGKNEEVRFEGVGLTLSQALGRVGGLQNERADPKGVFVFRWEKPEVVRGVTGDAYANMQQAVPVIYQADLKRPDTYFAAQRFHMRDGDVLYVANSAAADLQRFVNILASSILPVSTVRNLAR
jgi:polysaccharide export outer membrane protein